VVQEACLNDLRELRDHIFLFEEEIVLVVLGIDQDASDCIKEVAKDLLEVSGLIKCTCRCEDVLLKDFKEKLDVDRGNSDDRARIFDGDQTESAL